MDDFFFLVSQSEIQDGSQSRTLFNIGLDGKMLKMIS